MSGTSSLWLFVILALNFGISWWNARSCGRAWVESKAVGGGIRLLVWCGAIQSAIGFSSVFLFPLIFVANALFPDYFTDEYLNGAVNLWYITIIFPALGTGFIITIEFLDRSLPPAQPDELGNGRLQHVRADTQHHGGDRQPAAGV